MLKNNLSLQFVKDFTSVKDYPCVLSNFKAHAKSSTLVLRTFLSEGYITYYTTAQGPDTLRNVTVSGDVVFYQIIKFFVNAVYYSFHN